MSETPSWLEANNENPPAVPAEPANTSTLETTSTNAASDPMSSTKDEKDLPTIILYMRLANMGAAVALITISVSKL